MTVNSGWRLISSGNRLLTRMVKNSSTPMNVIEALGYCPIFSSDNSDI
jgi:hypothetical protein